MSGSGASGQLDPIAVFAGETMAKAITTIARGRILTPFGATRTEDGGADQEQQFAVDKDGKIDLAESAEAALQWLEDAAPRADICMVVIDGFINEDNEEEGIDAVVGRIISLKREIMVELALPYEPNEGEEGFSFSEPVFNFSGGDSDAVDTEAFDVVFRNAFMTHAPRA